MVAYYRDTVIPFIHCCKEGVTTDQSPSQCRDYQSKLPVNTGSDGLRSEPHPQCAAQVAENSDAKRSVRSIETRDFGSSGIDIGCGCPTITTYTVTVTITISKSIISYSTLFVVWYINYIQCSFTNSSNCITFTISQCFQNHFHIISLNIAHDISQCRSSQSLKWRSTHFHSRWTSVHL